MQSYLCLRLFLPVITARPQHTRAHAHSHTQCCLCLRLFLPVITRVRTIAHNTRAHAHSHTQGCLHLRHFLPVNTRVCTRAHNTHTHTHKLSHAGNIPSCAQPPLSPPRRHHPREYNPSEWMSYLLRTAVEAVHPGSRSESRYEFLLRDSKVKLTVVVDLRFLLTLFDYLLVLFPLPVFSWFTTDICKLSSQRGICSSIWPPGPLWYTSYSNNVYRFEFSM
jgi:hypothetical protein